VQIWIPIAVLASGNHILEVEVVEWVAPIIRDSFSLQQRLPSI
jgi:hypothetical protein